MYPFGQEVLFGFAGWDLLKDYRHFTVVPWVGKGLIPFLRSASMRATPIHLFARYVNSPPREGALTSKTSALLLLLVYGLSSHLYIKSDINICRSCKCK